MPGTGNRRVFVSHAHEDNDRCAPLVAALDAWGIEYWFDTQRMDAGDDLSERIQAAIATHDIFLRVCTQAAQSSFWMSRELGAFNGLQAADHKAGQPNKRKFIPLRLNAAYQFTPFELGTLYIDAVGRQQREWLGELRRALALQIIEADSRQPGELIVDCMRRGDYATISEAISAAQPGTRIVVCPGLYQEGLVIDKPLEIVGQGELGEVVIEAQGSEIIKSRADGARVSNLKLRQAGGGKWYGVYIVRGWVALEGNDISSQSGACVAVQGAFARLNRNVIHDGNVSGVYVFEGGQSTLDVNQIFANGKDGVQINSKGSVTLRRNTIHNNRRCGVNVHHSSAAVIDDNDLISNRTGIEVTTGGHVQARNNRISRHSNEAISVYNGGGGSFVGTTMHENAKGNWYIAPDCEGRVAREGNIEV